MSQTITITSNSVAHVLGQYLYKLGNFDPTQFRPMEFGRPSTINPETFQIMLASESLLAREWDTPEEDAAWADL